MAGTYCSLYGIAGALIGAAASAALPASSTILANDLLTLVRRAGNPMLATRVVTLVGGIAVVSVSLVLNDPGGRAHRRL